MFIETKTTFEIKQIKKWFYSNKEEIKDENLIQDLNFIKAESREYHASMIIDINGSPHALVCMKG